MLPQKRRVGTHLFPFVLEKGKNPSSQYFSFKYVHHTEPSESKFSFVVSGKVAKKATERNLLKRRGHQVIQQKGSILRKVPIAGVFFAKKGATHISYREIEKEITGLLNKAHLL